MDTNTRKPYLSDLTDAQWAVLEPLLLAFESRVRPGPEATVDLREVLNTLLYLFFPRPGECQAARSRSFSANSRNLCGSGGPERTASIS